MTKQLRFPTMRNLKPPIPTIRSEHVALRIAQRIVDLVNGQPDDKADGFHWDAAEIPDRIWDIQQEIMRVGRPATVITRLYRRQPLDEDGEHPGHPWGWEGMDDDCRALGGAIAAEELTRARKAYTKRYG